MRDLITIGASVSPRAYRGADGRVLQAMPAIELVAHEFLARPDGCLEHRIEGNVRAIVPPEAMRDYCEFWPDAKPVVDELLAADHGTPSAELGDQGATLEVKKDTSIDNLVDTPGTAG